MLAYLSIFIGLFLIALGLVAIYVGILTYIRLCSATLVATGDLINDRHIVFVHGLNEADTPIYCPSRPLFMLASMVVIGVLPLSFGVLLFVRMIGLF
jgi:hypothetical protein